MIKKTALLILIFSLLICCVGCGEYNHKQDPQSENENTFLVIETSQCNIDNDVDSWIGSVQTVFYDGKIVYHDVYSKSGEKNQDNWTVEDTVIKDVFDYLWKIRKTQEDTQLEGGIQYSIRYYNIDGSLIREFIGYDSDEFVQYVSEKVGPWIIE